MKKLKYILPVILAALLIALFSTVLPAQGFPLTNPTSLPNGSFVVVQQIGGNTTGVAVDSFLGAGVYMPLAAGTVNQTLRYDTVGTDGWEATGNLVTTVAGNVGIGTTSPLGTLEVKRATAGSAIYVNGVTTTGTNYGIDSEVLGAGATLNVGGYFMASGGTSNYAINIPANTPAAGANNYAIYSASQAQSYFAGNVGIGATVPDRLLHAESSTALTATTNYPFRLSHITSGPATTNFGIGIEYELENASGTNRVAGTEEFTWSDATDATEDATYTLKLMRAGTLTTALTVESSGALTTSGGLIAGGAIATSIGNRFRWTSGSSIFGPSDGVIELTNSAITDFNRLQFGGTTSAFPSLQRSGAGLIVRLADDSANAALAASTLNLDKTITAAATTGNQTINKAMGSVNFAAAATSLVVTNSLVDANSVILCTVAENDGTMKSVACKAGAGSFTIYANTAATAETRVNFVVLN